MIYIIILVCITCVRALIYFDSGDIGSLAIFNYELCVTNHQTSSYISFKIIKKKKTLSVRFMGKSSKGFISLL